MADPVSLAINAAIVFTSMAIQASQEFEGPRLDDLPLNFADYGGSLNYAWGRQRFDGLTCIFSEPIKQVKRRRKTKGGKFNEYTTFGTWASVVCDHPVSAVTRLWLDRKLAYDATGAGPITPIDLVDAGAGPVGEAVDGLGLGQITDYITFYLGADDQEPDPRMAATVDAIHGEGSTPAYRGVTYVMFKDLPLEKFGNRFPTVSVEVVTDAAPAFPYAERTAANEADLRMWMSADGTRVTWTSLDNDDGSITHIETWDVRAAALMAHTTLDSINTFARLGFDTAGRIHAAGASAGQLVVLDPEGGGPLKVVGPPDAGWGANYADFPNIGAVAVLGNTAYASGVANENHGWSYHYPGDFASLIDTRELTGGLSCQVKFYFADAYGGHWLLGGKGGLDDDELLIHRLVAGADSPFTVGSARITMPVSHAGVTASVNGFHCRADGEDRLIVGFGDGTGCVVALDWATLEIVAQTTAAGARFDDWHAAGVAPGSRYLWNNCDQWDYVNMTIVRSVDPADYNVAYSGTPTAIYDRLSNALIWNDTGSATLSWLYLDKVSAGDGPTLESIVVDVSQRCRLVDGTDFDASDLTQTVRGYSARQAPAKAWLEPLLAAYDSEVRPHDFLLEFRRRGEAMGAAIPVADMGAGGTVRYTAPALSETDLSLKLNLTFADVDKDLQPNVAVAQRVGAAVDSRRETTFDGSTLVLTVGEARQIVERELRYQWIKAQTFELSLTRAYTGLEAGDARPLVLDDVTVTAKLTRNEFGANGVLTQTWERYHPSVHTGVTPLAGADGDGLTPGEVQVFGYTKGLFLDIPLVDDGHDAATPIAYLAAAPYSDLAWPGASFFRADDLEEPVYDVELGSVASNERATMGRALSALPDALSTVWDMASAVTVEVTSGELTSATKAEVANGANRAILGREVIGFTTATLIAPRTYQLSGLHRGRRGTEWATGMHAVGDRFALLAGLPRVAMGAGDVGDTFLSRPTTNAGPAGFPEEITFMGAALKPYAPAHLSVVDDGGDLVATWVRRTRVGGAWRDFTEVPLGEGSESYVVQVLDAGGALVRNLGPVSTPTATYTAADIATDAGAGETLRVMQVSTVVGNGYPADIAI
jgi:hypothetical protein